MPTRITQTDHKDQSLTVLRVEGSLLIDDAVLIERLCRDIQESGTRTVALDLSGLSFLDSESASVLWRLKRERGVEFEGVHLFIQKMIELAEQGK